MPGVVKISHIESFDLVKKIYEGTDVRFSTHLPMGVAGGLSMLENATLFALMKIVEPKNIFEFGTYLGASTVLLAENSSEKTKVFTLDLPEDSIETRDINLLDQTDKDQNDDFLRGYYKVSGSYYIDKASDVVKNKITLIKSDSKSFDFSPYNNMFDFIFIDGGHSYDIIESDTRNAIDIVKTDALVVWHDYMSLIHSDVTDFIHDYESENTIYHVDNTMLAFMPLGRYKSIFSEVNLIDS